jgi:hypothetical protein
MKRYLKVRWHHTNPDDPIVYLSEVDLGVEVRKIEKFADGRVSWAGPDGSTGDSFLAEGLMPFPDEIDAQDEFTTSPTDAEEFEREWEAARASQRDVEEPE